MLVWCEVQLPDREMYGFLEGLKQQVKAKFKDKGKPDDEPGEKPDLENRWILSPGDRKKLIQNPWLYELCLRCVMNHPEELKFNEIKLPDGITQHELIRKYLATWIENEFLVVSDTGIKTTKAHIYAPKDWYDVRQTTYDRAYADLREVCTNEAQQENSATNYLIYRNFTKKQIKEFIARLQELKNEVLNYPYESDPTETRYALLTLFGPRALDELKK